jgi:hypothetical protein
MPHIFLPWKWTSISLLPSLFIFSPLFPNFMLLPILHSLFSPYPPILTLFLVFTSFILYFTPLSLPHSMYLPYFLTYVGFLLLDLSSLTSHQNPQ